MRKAQRGFLLLLLIIIMMMMMTKYKQVFEESRIW